MKVLIISKTREVARLWGRHLMRNGLPTALADTPETAIAAIREHPYAVIVIDAALGADDVCDISGYAAYRRPDSKLVIVSNSTFFSNCQVFHYLPNTCVVMSSPVSLVDLEAVVGHHAGAVFA